VAGAAAEVVGEATGGVVVVPGGRGKQVSATATPTGDSLPYW